MIGLLVGATFAGSRCVSITMGTQKEGVGGKSSTRPREPKAEPDHGNNLYPAHISCNREKGTLTSRTVRDWHGRTRAPLSKERQEAARESNALAGAAFGALAGLVVSRLMKPTEPREDQEQHGRPVSIMPVVMAVLVVAVVGAIIAYHLNTEN